MKFLTRRQFAQSMMATAVLPALGQDRSPKSTKQPNVLFVIADEWRAQAFGFAGDSNAHTPTFDRFASQSLNFTEAVSSCPVCCPARASLISGQYALKHGVYINDVPFVPKSKTLAEIFQDGGYTTGYIGKWHLYGSPDGHYGRREAYIPPDKRFGFEYWKAAECTHNYNHSFYYEGDDPTKKYWPGYDAIAQTADASNFIRQHANSKQPYFMVLSWGPPHFPLNTAPERYKKLYENRDIVLRPNVAPDKKSEAVDDLRGYYAHIAALDDCFSQLLDTVEASGASEDTIVVFTSDHGDMMESQGLTTKLYPWEESARIPLLIRYPRKYGRISHQSNVPLSTPDIMPTLLGLSGLPIPGEVQGTNYCAPSAIPKLGSAKTAFLNMPVPITTGRNYGIAEYRAVRSSTHTYVRSIHGPWLLYDNKNDPYQMHNLCNHPESKNLQDEMEAELNIWLHALNDKFLPAEEYLKRDHLTNYMEPYAAISFTRSPWGDWESTLPSRRFSVDSPLSVLMKNSEASTILNREVPELDAKQKPNASLRQMQHMGFAITDAKLDRIDNQLAELKDPGSEAK